MSVVSNGKINVPHPLNHQLLHYEMVQMYFDISNFLSYTLMVGYFEIHQNQQNGACIFSIYCEKDPAVSSSISKISTINIDLTESVTPLSQRKAAAAMHLLSVNMGQHHLQIVIIKIRINFIKKHITSKLISSHITQERMWMITPNITDSNHQSIPIISNLKITDQEIQDLEIDNNISI